jgi:hypothetical protein
MVTIGITDQFLKDSGRPRNFRCVGLEMFLQVLVQFQQLAHGWSPRLYLQQKLLSGNLVLYYLKWGYMHVPWNIITSVPGVPDDSFLNNHVYAVSDEFQEQEKIKPYDFLVLHYVDGFVVTTFLVNVLPPDKTIGIGGCH